MKRRVPEGGEPEAAWGILPLAPLLAMVLLACGRDDRRDVPEAVPRREAGPGPATAPITPAPAADTSASAPEAAVLSVLEFLSEEELAGLSDSALEDLDPQPKDAYYDLARSLDSAGNKDNAEEQALPVAVLTPGTFHGDEVADADSSRDWLGLWRDSSGTHRWERTRVRIEPVKDELLDENSSRMTGKRVRTAESRDFLVLADGPDRLPEGPVPVLDSLARALPPGIRLAFRFLGKEYRLAATIGPPYRLPDGRVVTTRDYRLFLTRIKDGSETTRLILHVGSLDDKVPSLGLAGDLDGDGHLDLILEDSGHYNVTATSLYFSRPGGPDAFPQRVGSHRSVGC